MGHKMIDKMLMMWAKLGDIMEDKVKEKMFLRWAKVEGIMVDKMVLISA